MNRVYRVKELDEQKNCTSADSDRVKRELTERLLKYAVWNQDKTEVNWFKVQMSSYGKQTWNINPMGMYLYDGLAGMLLIFDRLKEADGRKEICRIADTLEKMLFAYTNAGAETIDNLCSGNTGAYEGESSIIYTYLILYRTSRREIYLDYAKKHARILENLLENDNKYDLLSGNAGAVMVLIDLYEKTKDKSYIDMAERAMDVLIQTAQKYEHGIGWSIEKGIPPMAGMAHGNSGILMAAIALWKKTGKKLYENLSEEVWSYENALYNPDTNNWNDVRVKNQEDDPTGAVAWCHGAPGILLSRLYCYQNVCTPEWRERMETDIRWAYKKTKEFWMRDSYCLCHGTFGNLWILELAAQVFGEDEGSCQTPCSLAESMKLLPQEKINPGFMNGYGGVLYSLLNF